MSLWRWIRYSRTAKTQARPEVASSYLVQAAELALRAGVRLSLADWRNLSSAERGAWAAAGERLAVAAAARAGFAAQSLEGYATVLEPVDGGAAAAELRQAREDAELRRRLEQMADETAAMVHGVQR